MADVSGSLTTTVSAVTSTIGGHVTKTGALTLTVPAVTSIIAHGPVSRSGTLTARLLD